MKFTTRAYNSLVVNKVNNSTIIKESLENKLQDEIFYYRNLPEKLKIYFPRLIEENTSGTKPYKLELEYYGYSNLGTHMMYNKFDKNEWSKVLDFIFKYIDNYKDVKRIKSNRSDIRRMLINKTEDEYQKLIDSNPFFKKFSKYESLNLNNKTLLNFKTIWNDVKKQIEAIDLDSYFYYFHGDLCFSNILFSKNPLSEDVILKFVDPRGKYGLKKFYGDYYYDLAKLSHSVNGGYEYLIYDEFNLEIKKNKANLKYLNKNKDKVNNLFIQKLNDYKYDLEIINLIEGLIYIGMCARHYDSLKRQKAMYLIGVKLLNSFYEKI